MKWASNYRRSKVLIAALIIILISGVMFSCLDRSADLRALSSPKILRMLQVVSQDKLKVLGEHTDDFTEEIRNRLEGFSHEYNLTFVAITTPARVRVSSGIDPARTFMSEMGNIDQWQVSSGYFRGENGVEIREIYLFKLITTGGMEVKLYLRKENL